MENTFPATPVYSCEGGNFEVYDGNEIREQIARRDHAKPWMILRSGVGNIFESVPKQIVKEHPMAVAVECWDTVVIHLDFEEGTAHKDSLEGKFMYRGSLEDGNDGQGYIRM
ncbi:MAG: hypothetical protein VX800_03840 [Chloroflexota bacterium]|nr:hypothetical protein [Chloroflexota bacterium]